MILIFMKGFGVGAGLIVAIGAQNAFVLTQGIKRQFWIIIPLICALCDAVLISAGVSGMGHILSENENFTLIARWGGAAFLFLYGSMALRSVFRSDTLEMGRSTITTLKGAVLTTLALTLLNPHVYIDTVLLMGTIGNCFQGEKRVMFAAGAISASCVWFFSLSMGGTLLKSLFQRPVAWKVLDGVVCITMWSIAGSLSIMQI